MAVAEKQPSGNRIDQHAPVSVVSGASTETGAAGDPATPAPSGIEGKAVLSARFKTRVKTHQTPPFQEKGAAIFSRTTDTSGSGP
ncbi:MAG: hypothetical protein Kow0060_07780 [Methylohalobius crimeensis]